MNKKIDIDYLSFDDLNYIENKIQILTNQIKELYIESMPIYNEKTWELNELPYIQEIDRIEKGVENLGLYYLKPNGWLPTKKWITRDNLYPIKSFDYRDYNRWLDNLKVIEENIENPEITLWNGISQINWNEISNENWIEGSNYITENLLYNNEEILYNGEKVRIKEEI